jgi:predicted small lipoprotein YifL
MKKLLAIVIAMLMVFALFACGEKTPEASPSASAPASTAPASEAPASEAPASEAPATEEPKSGAVDIGFYDATFDYSSNPTYKIAYMYSGTAFCTICSASPSRLGQKIMNIEYNSFSAADPTHS